MLISGNLPLSMACPCGSGEVMSACCAPFIQGQLQAPTAEKLMRSRYSAYYTKNIDYLVNTHHPTTRKNNSRRQITATANSVTWIGLTVIATEAGQPEDQNGMVEFMAVYNEGNAAAQLHERSQFVQEKGQWFYVDGEMLPPIRPKKNEPCWCGSGKKFKQCHGKKR